MNRTLLRRTGAALGTLLATATLGVGTAYAVDTSVHVISMKGYGVAGDFDHTDDRDRFKVSDVERDGYSVTGTLILGANTIVARGWDRDGENAHIDVFDYNIVKGEVYTMMVCLVDGHPNNRIKCEHKELKE